MEMVMGGGDGRWRWSWEMAINMDMDVGTWTWTRTRTIAMSNSVSASVGAGVPGAALAIKSATPSGILSSCAARRSSASLECGLPSEDGALVHVRMALDGHLARHARSPCTRVEGPRDLRVVVFA